MTIIIVCPLPFFSRPRSEGSRHHGRTFSIHLTPLSFWLTLPRGTLSTYWCCPPRPCVRGLPRLRAPGIIHKTSSRKLWRRSENLCHVFEVASIPLAEPSPPQSTLATPLYVHHITNAHHKRSSIINRQRRLLLLLLLLLLLMLMACAPNRHWPVRPTFPEHRGGSRGWLGWLVTPPWRGSLFHVIVMR